MLTFEPTNRSFTTELQNFLENNALICIGTLGLAILFYGAGNLLGRAVTAISESIGTSKKVDSQKKHINPITTSPGSISKLSYHTLPNKSDLEKITHIITTLGSGSLFTLYGSKDELDKLGKALKHLHPLRFIATAVTHPKLKSELIKIKARTMVWEPFFTKNVIKLKRERNKGNLDCYIEDFAKDLKIDNVKLKKLADNNSWQELFDTILSP